MSVCVCSYVFFWEGTVGEEESVVMELWQSDLLPDTCRVSNWRCPNSPSLAGQGKEEGRARVKITPKPITSRKKYKTPPSLLLSFPLYFTHSHFPYLSSQEDTMAPLSCIVLRVAAAAEMRMSVMWEEEGGREEEGKGGLSCPMSGCGFWTLGFWTVPNQHKGDCSDYFLHNWNPTSYLHFEF